MFYLRKDHFAFGISFLPSKTFLKDFSTNDIEDNVDALSLCYFLHPFSYVFGLVVYGELGAILRSEFAFVWTSTGSNHL